MVHYNISIIFPMQKIVRSASRASRVLAPMMAYSMASMPLGSLPTFQSPYFNYSSKFLFSSQAHENVSKSSHEGAGFYMEQLLTGCLSLYSYYIESGT